MTEHIEPMSRAMRTTLQRRLSKLDSKHNGYQQTRIRIENRRKFKKCQYNVPHLILQEI